MSKIQSNTTKRKINAARAKAEIAWSFIDGYAEQLRKDQEEIETLKVTLATALADLSALRKLHADTLAVEA